MAGKDGEKQDGSLTVKDKADKAGVTIKAKDGKGTIGLNGTNGASTNIEVVKDDNKKPLDNTGNGTRLTYTDGGATRQVASLDDGLKFEGDDQGKTVNRKLSETLKIKGGATNLTENNIGVIANATNDGLEVRLAKDVNLGADGSVTAGTGDKQVKLDGKAGNVTVGDGKNNTPQTTIGKETINVGKNGEKGIVINGTDGTITGLKGALVVLMVQVRQQHRGKPTL